VPNEFLDAGDITLLFLSGVVQDHNHSAFECAVQPTLRAGRVFATHVPEPKVDGPLVRRRYLSGVSREEHGNSSDSTLIAPFASLRKTVVFNVDNRS
jgi:hypothetical protein